MKKEFISYLESIGITGAILNKIIEIYNFYNKFLGFELEDIFVTEYLNMDGTRTYEDVVFFNKEFMFEAKFFLAEDNFDSDKIVNRIRFFEFTKTDYDIVQNITSDKSRATLLFKFAHVEERYGELKASKDNCKKLREIFLKYILPNYIKN